MQKMKIDTKAELMAHESQRNIMSEDKKTPRKQKPWKREGTNFTISHLGEVRQIVRSYGEKKKTSKPSRERKSKELQKGARSRQGRKVHPRKSGAWDLHIQGKESGQKGAKVGKGKKKRKMGVVFGRKQF